MTLSEVRLHTCEMPLIIHIETQSYHFDRETYVTMKLCLKYRAQFKILYHCFRLSLISFLT